MFQWSVNPILIYLRFRVLIYDGSLRKRINKLMQ